MGPPAPAVLGLPAPFPLSLLLPDNVASSLPTGLWAKTHSYVIDHHQVDP